MVDSIDYVVPVVDPATGRATQNLVLAMQNLRRTAQGGLVAGPLSTTNGAIALWSGTDGMTLQNGPLPSSFATSAQGSLADTAVQPSESVLALDDITGLAGLSPDDGQQFSRRQFWPGTGVGGVDLYWDASRPVADHNGGTVIDPAKIAQLDTGAKTFGTYFAADTVSGNTGCFVAFGANINMHTFGCVGDNGTDDTAAAQAAIDSTAGELSTGEGGAVFKVSRLLGRSRLQLTGNGTFDFSANADYATSVDDPLFFFRGTAGPVIAVSSNVAISDTVINVSDTSTLSPGRIIEIATPGQTAGFIDSSVVVHNGELLKIEEIIDATSFRTSDSVVDEFGYSTADSAQIRLLDTIDDVVIGPDIKIIGKGRPGSGPGDFGVVFFYGNRVKVHCDFLDVDCNAVRFEGCYDYEASGCHVVHAPKGANGAVNYGIVPSGSSTHGHIFKCKLENMRHGIVTSHLSSGLGLGLWGVSRHIDIHHNTCVNTWHAAIATHNDADRVSIHHNRHVNCAFAVNPRERNAVVAFEEIIGCNQCIYLSSHPRNILIYGVKARDCPGRLVTTSFNTDRAVTGIQVVNCVAERCVGGVSFTSVSSPAASDIEIRGNEFRDIVGAGGAAAVIRYAGAAADSLRIYDNVLKSITNLVGIKVDAGGDKVFILRNTVDGSDSTAFNTLGTYTKSYGKGNFVADAGTFWSGALNLQNGVDILTDNTLA